MSDLTETQICVMHSLAANDLQRLLKHYAKRKQELQEDLDDLSRWEWKIRKAVERGEWYALEGYLDSDLIDLLSDCEPTDRMSLLNDAWE